MLQRPLHACWVFTASCWLLFAAPFAACGQAHDPYATDKVADTARGEDAALSYDGAYAADEPDFPARAERVYEERSFDQAALRKYRQDKQYDYDREKKDAATPSWLEKLLEWLMRDSDAPNVNMPGMNWDWLAYALAAFCVALLLFGVFRMRLQSIFFPQPKPLAMSYEVAQEDIRDMRFDDALTEAISQGMYRRAVRLLYLDALKELSAKGFIAWRLNKTNYDYLAEIAQSQLKPAFADLTRQYEYAWYGGFAIEQRDFQSIQDAFKAFRNSLQQEKRPVL